MKRFCVFLFAVLLCIPVFPVSWRSNVIGQKLEGTAENAEYILEENGGTEQLFHNGKLIRTTTRTVSGNSETVTVTDHERGLVRTTVFRDQRPFQITETDGNSETVWTFTYTDGSLLYTTEVRNGETAGVEYYLRSASDNRLIGIRKYDSTSLFGEAYLFQEENLYVNAASDLIVQGDFEVGDGGEITFTRDGITYTYSAAGLLLRETDGTRKTEYSYDPDGILARTETTEGTFMRIRTYQDGVPAHETSSENGVVTEEIQYTGTEAGMVKTVYSRGRAAARIYYQPDNRRVLNIEYIK